MMLKKLLMLALGCFLIGSLFTMTTYAADYPKKPIEILCPYTPGSSVDIMDRIIAEIAPKYLGQPMVVVNKPGAGGGIAAAEVIRAEPDGYKLVSMANAFFATTAKIQKIPFDPNEIEPLANFIEYKLGLAVKGDSPWKTLPDLIAHAKANPGALKWAHSGRGITTHLNGKLIFKRAGVQDIDIPYKGSPESLTALLGGHVDAAAIPYGTALEQVKAGKVRFLVFFSDRRYGDPADVPCALDLGFSEASKLVTLFGIYGHKNIPEKRKAILIDAFQQIYEHPTFQEGIAKSGEEPRFGGSDFVKESIRKAEEVGVPMIKELGLYSGN